MATCRTQIPKGNPIILAGHRKRTRRDTCRQQAVPPCGRGHSVQKRLRRGTSPPHVRLVPDPKAAHGGAQGCPCRDRTGARDRIVPVLGAATDGLPTRVCRPGEPHKRHDALEYWLEKNSHSFKISHIFSKKIGFTVLQFFNTHLIPHKKVSSILKIMRDCKHVDYLQ
jgi:hypothetical protein